jgi:hypothetical protein
MSRIVTTSYRYKPPPREQKAVAIAGPAVVRDPSRAMHKIPAAEKVEAPDISDNGYKKRPAIITTTRRKRTKLLRFEQAAEPEDDPEATPRVKAFVARMVRPPQ